MSFSGHPYADLLESPALSPTHKRTLSAEEHNAIYWAGISNPSNTPPPPTSKALWGGLQKPKIDFEAYPGAGLSLAGIQHKQASKPARRSVSYHQDPKVEYAASSGIPQGPVRAEFPKGKLTTQGDGSGCCVIL